MYVHNKSFVDLAGVYQKKLIAAIESEDLLEVIKDEWCLAELPSVSNVRSKFVESKEKKKQLQGLRDLELNEKNEECRLEEDSEMTRVRVSIRFDEDSAKSPKFKLLS